MEAVRPNGMSSTAAKSKPNTSVGISKSKQLKDKKPRRESSRRTRSKKKATGTIMQPNPTFEDNTIQNAETSTLSAQLSTLSKPLVPAETDRSHILPPKKRRNGENDLSTKVEYTSIVKRESVLVIRKQISQCDDDEDDVPLKRMKHSIDSILSNSCETTNSTNKIDHKVEVDIPDVSPPPIEDNCKQNEISEQAVNDIDDVLNDSEATLPFGADSDSDKTEPYDYIAESPPTSPLHPTSPPAPILPPPSVSPLPPASPLFLGSPQIMLDSPPPQTSSPPLNSPTAKQGSASPLSFEPIPSTSRDNAVFEKNQEMLEKCMGADDDCEIIETPVETIDLEEYSPPTSIRRIPCSNAEPIDVDDEEVKFVGYQSIPTFSDMEVKSILNELSERASSAILINVDNGNSDDCEIIDVDEVMAHSDKILRRFKQRTIPSLITTQAPSMPDQQPIEIEDAFQLRDMDTGNIDDESLEDLYNVFAPIHVPPPTLSSDPVMASVTSQQPRTNRQPASAVSSIVDSYFQNNPVPTTSNLVPTTKKSAISNISSTLGNILDVLTGSFRSYTDATSQSGSSRLPQTASYDLTAAADPVEVVGTSHMYSPYQRNYETATSDALPYYVPSTLYQQGPAIRPVYYVNPSTSVSIAPMTSVPPAHTRTTAPSAKSPESKESAVSGARSMECPICMESLSSRQPASTICGHLFCWSCIEKAVNAPGGRRCPTCRKPFNKKGQSYHKIYF